MFHRAWRRLRAAPVFTVFAVASLALGVGVTTAIYSVVASLTDARLAVPNPDRIGFIVGSDAFYGRRLSWRSILSRADFIDLQQAGDTWKQAAVSARFSQSLVTPALSEMVTGEAVSGNYFTALGLSPFQGRLVQLSDDAAPALVAVVSHQFWQSRLGADPAALGSTLRIGGKPFEVIGITPPGFTGLVDRIQSYTAVWVPLGATTMFPSTAAPPDDPQERRRLQLSVFVPVPGPGALQSLSQEVAAVGARLDTAYPIELQYTPDSARQKVARGWSIRSAAEINDEGDRTMGRTRTAVMAIVGLVLVVACTNLANLVLARASSRQHELAVRGALGASRVRLILDELAETSLLAALGAIGAFIVARTLIIWFSSASIPISQATVVQIEPQVDFSTAAVAAMSVMASLVVFGLLPAIQVTRTALRPQLSSDSGAAGHLRWHARRRLISLQVAISLAFTLIAVFAVRVAVGERLRSSGIDVDRLAIGLLNFRLPPWTQSRALDAIGRLESLGPTQPGIEAIAVVSGLPFGTNFTPQADLALPGQASTTNRFGYTFAPFIAATPSVFATLGVSIVKGRPFDSRDNGGAPPVIVLSEHTARQVFGSTDIVGRPVVLKAGQNMTNAGAVTTLTVVGIASDTDTQRRYSRDAGAVYVPLAQHYEPSLAIVGRTSGDPADMLGQLRTLARRADPDLVVDRPATAAMMLTGAYVLIGIVSRAAGGLALLALVLAMAGLFGVLSHLVARRTREMGLRMALGADPDRIRRLVIGDGLRPVLAGVGVGWAVGLIVRFLLRAAYANPLSMTDLLAFLIAPVPIVAAALVACYWPARRASAVDPNVALREL